MTAGELLAVFETLVKAALPTWTVIPGQARVLEDKLAEIVLMDGSIGGFFNGGMEISETVTVRLAVKPSDPPRVAYLQLMDARDAVALRFIETVSTLISSGVLPFEGSPSLQTAEMVMELQTEKAHWATEIRFPIKRRIG